MSSFTDLLNEFKSELRQCQQLYAKSASLIAYKHSNLIGIPPVRFVEQMQDLYRGLILKLFVTIAGADDHWTIEEEQLANTVIFQLWQEQFTGKELRDAIRQLLPQANSLDWRSLVGPFSMYAPLAHEVPQLETHIIRLGNLIAKADGKVSSVEMVKLSEIQHILMAHLYLEEVSDEQLIDLPRDPNSSDQELQLPGSKKSSASPHVTSVQPPEESLETAMGELEELIGLDSVKQQVDQLVNFIKVQRMRSEQGLAETPLSLHMVFGGNPGTGKTTVARILGRVYGAMGILDKGHMVETDRSGLVAEFAGQTGPKTNKIIDQALDGVLFIDEAYSLVAESNEDPYGRECIQALLKRMEDDRDRLIVILAGYPDEMNRLLETNPGLSSRFNHRIDFQDFEPKELGQIFRLMCEKNQYEMNADVLGKLLVGLGFLHSERDKHFGNGRLVRNIFEKAIRHLADRIVDIPEITRELLVQFDASDIQLDGVPQQVLADSQLKESIFKVDCPNCSNQSKIKIELLGRKVKCPKCDSGFQIESANPV